MHQIDPDLVKSFPADMLHRYQFVPLDRIGKVMTIAVAGTFDERIVEFVKEVLDAEPMFFIATPSDVMTVLQKHVPLTREQEKEIRERVKEDAKKISDRISSRRGRISGPSKPVKKEGEQVFAVGPAPGGGDSGAPPKTRPLGKPVVVLPARKEESGGGAAAASGAKAPVAKSPVVKGEAAKKAKAPVAKAPVAKEEAAKKAKAPAKKKPVPKPPPAPKPEPPPEPVREEPPAPAALEPPEETAEVVQELGAEEAADGINWQSLFDDVDAQIREEVRKRGGRRREELE